MFRPIYSQCEILLLRIEEGLQTQDRGDEEVERQRVLAQSKPFLFLI